MKLGPLTIHPQRIAIFTGIAILLFLILNLNSRLEELARLQNEKATVSARGTAIVVTRYALETQQAFATSPSAVEQYAREQAHMAQPGDKPVVPLQQPGATPPPQPISTPAAPNLTNWDVWMAFLFEK
ncbi:MAG: hypothetical protein EHM81_01180 [Chloroflexi bacterium]|nr:MAG: hypothetical protein EHM81_01180 [Chloroflexota bacterium]